MTNGFYNIGNKPKLQQKAFIKDALLLAYSIRCESKYKKSSYREIDKELTVKQLYDSFFNLKQKDSAKIVCIDRYIYNDSGIIPKEHCEFEIGLMFDWIFLYIFVNKDSFQQLIEKYNLELIDWK